MQVDEFEWDDDKAARNSALHGVSFEFATRVFSDPAAVERADYRFEYGEDRYSIIGMAGMSLAMSPSPTAMTGFAL